jgi:hypothetical protein
MSDCDSEINRFYQTTYTNWVDNDAPEHPKLYKTIDAQELKKLICGEYLFARKFENNSKINEMLLSAIA